MKNLPANAALIIIDVQKGFDAPYWGTRNNPKAEINISSLLMLWRETKKVVVHVQHMSIEPESPLNPDFEGNEFKEEFTPIYGEHIEQKKVNSAFIGTTLESYLRTNRVDSIVIAGLTTDHCVSTTARMAGNLGFNTFLVADATATFNRKGFDGKEYSADEIFNTALASLHNEFATVLNTDELIALVRASQVRAEA